MSIFDNLINYVNGAQTASATYTPSKPYTGGLPSGTVKKGNRSTNVKHVQNFLNWCINAKLSVDGYCGKYTTAAIKKYQKTYKLKVDGIFGAASKKKAQSIIAKYAPKPAPVKTNTLTDKLLDACATQAEWMKNSKYKWQSNPTVAKSKTYGTCVTYVACVLQRIGYLDSGKYVWHDTKGKVYGATSKMTVIYPSNTTLKAYKSSLKAGDIVIDGSKSDVQGGSHIFVLTGQWSGDKPIIWDNHSAQQKGGKSYVYSRNRNLIAVIRLK